MGFLMFVLGMVIKLGIYALIARGGKASRATRRTTGELTIDPNR